MWHRHNTFVQLQLNERLRRASLVNWVLWTTGEPLHKQLLKNRPVVQWSSSSPDMSPTVGPVGSSCVHVPGNICFSCRISLFQNKGIEMNRWHSNRRIPNLASVHSGFILGPKNTNKLLSYCRIRMIKTQQRHIRMRTLTIRFKITWRRRDLWQRLQPATRGQSLGSISGVYQYIPVYICIYVWVIYFFIIMIIVGAHWEAIVSLQRHRTAIENRNNQLN